MPKRKIRHALVQYKVEGRGFETAFRNQIVDIPEDQVERLDRLGATVAVDAELERPGKMLALPETASDAEILNWVMGATSSEVENLVRERPVMASRLEAAKAAVDERFQEQNLHLGGLKEIADEALASADETLVEDDLIGEGETPAAGDGDIPPPAAGDDLIGDAPSFTAEQADGIVAGKAAEVIDYISNNPRNAAAILEAEGRRAESTKEEVRVTIVRAAEAAAGFTQ